MDGEFLNEVIETFLAEAIEHLDRFEALLLAAERGEPASDVIDELFRIAHSVKGSAALLGFSAIEAVMHAAEATLSQRREQKEGLRQEDVDPLIGVGDACRLILTSIQTDGVEGSLDVGAVAGALGVDVDGILQAEPTAAASEPPPSFLDRARSNSGAPPAVDQGAPGSLISQPPVVIDSAAEKASLRLPSDAQLHRRPAETPPGGDAKAVATDEKIRVKTKVLDRMMNLVGELVLVRNQITQGLSTDEGRDALSQMAQRLSHITTELQESVMATRMQPIETLWARFPRLVRETSRVAGKEVELLTEGAETELDRSIVEHLHDPLVHLLRNAIDHGIESAELRQQAQKPSVGQIRLRAFHEGGSIHIELSDDGSGIDHEKLWSRGVELGLIEEEAELVDRSRAVELLFHPGFSTREEVSALSGRGVGLDVVRANIERLGGTVTVESQLGSGTTFRLAIPITLAIVPALLVRGGDARFAVPQASLREVVHLSAERVAQTVTDIQGAATFQLREELLPLIYLQEAFKLGERAGGHDGLAVVVLESNESSFGLAVDEILDTEEIVVKPLWPPLRSSGCFAGATILGDGSVSLILDADGLGARARVVHSEAVLSDVKSEEQPTMALESVLTCQTGFGARIGFRLAEIQRLEEFPLAQVEKTGGGEMVQYRGRILPLVRLNDVLVERRKAPRGDELEPTGKDNLDVVVCRLGERDYGIVVDSILDVAETTIELQWPGARDGIKGSMVLSGRVTEFLDLDYLAAAVSKGTVA